MMHGGGRSIGPMIFSENLLKSIACIMCIVQEIGLKKKILLSGAAFTELEID